MNGSDFEDRDIVAPLMLIGGKCPEQAGEQREDYLVFARSVLPLDFTNVQLTPRDRHFLDVYLLNTEFRNLVVQMQETGGQEFPAG